MKTKQGHSFRNTRERLQTVLDIAKKLRNFPSTDGSRTVDLYNESFPAIAQLKKVFNEYIRNEHRDSVAGKIRFPEIHKTIEYILPAKSVIEPVFVLRATK